MTESIKQLQKGLHDGIPIGLGYLAVSFTFGIMAAGAGLTAPEAVLMSFTNLTSAGQFAGLGIIQAGGSLLEMAAAQLIINLRYCLMSCALSQKFSPDMPFLHRFFVSYGVTDEIFGVSVCRQGELSPFYNYGLMGTAVPGWTLGTLLGADLRLQHIANGRGRRVRRNDLALHDQSPPRLTLKIGHRLINATRDTHCQRRELALLLHKRRNHLRVEPGRHTTTRRGVARTSYLVQQMPLGSNLTLQVH